MEQGTEGLSLDAQRQRIEAWAVAAGAEIVEAIVDPGVSGSVALRDRPEGRRIAELMEARRPVIDAIVITRFDRLSRNAHEALGYLQTFSSGRIGLVSLADRIDLSTPQGRAMAGVGAVFAELERALCAQRTAEALGALRDSRRAYSPTPYGFVREAGRLVEIADEIEVVNEIGRWRSEGRSYPSIAEALNDRGVLARRGGRWYPSTVRSVWMTSTKLGVLDAAA